MFGVTVLCLSSRGQGQLLKITRGSLQPCGGPAVGNTQPTGGQETLTHYSMVNR